MSGASTDWHRDTLYRRTAVMGILNVTPDSFSDGGRFLEPAAAVAQGMRLADEGAAVIDIGGESTRPGADPVPADEEIRRVIPVVELLAVELEVPLSVDTSKLEVAERAVAGGATMVNDVTAFRAAPDLAAFCADHDLVVCLMHMQGRPREMQANPRYGDVVGEVRDFLEERLAFVVGEGVAEERVVLDPGIGFGKTVAHNLELLNRLDELVEIGRPVMVGTSRKSFIGHISGRPARERLPGTLASCVMAFDRGASLFRVHDVQATVDALSIARSIKSGTVVEAPEVIKGR